MPISVSSIFFNSSWTYEYDDKLNAFSSTGIAFYGPEGLNKNNQIKVTWDDGQNIEISNYNYEYNSNGLPIKMIDLYDMQEDIFEYSCD